jgi:flavin-dependent dehydrogenase
VGDVKGDGGREGAAEGPGPNKTAAPSAAAFDVVLFGGGLAGLCLARQLLREAPGMRVALVDPGRLPADPGRSKVGESSTEVSSWYLNERLGLGEHLESAQIKKLGLRFFLPGPTFAERPEFGLMTPGPRSFAVPFAGLNPTTWQLHRGRLEAALHSELVGLGVTIRPNTHATVRLGAPHRVDLDGERWTARWVVDASGGAGALPVDRDGDRVFAHRAQAAWFWVPIRVDPDRFSDDPDFRGRIPPDLRWRSTTHLVGDGYWVWLIALADGSTSVGVVTDPTVHAPETFAAAEGCQGWIARHEPALAEALKDTSWAGYSHRRWNSRLRRALVSDERWALTGDSAAFLDPLFSSGLDFLAIANELVVPRILADLAGRAVGREARRASSLFARIVEQYLHLYVGGYRVMGHPRAMMGKIVWDHAVYLGFLAPVVRSGALADEAFMTRVGFVGQAIATLQERVSAMLVRWAGHPCPPVRGTLDQTGCAPLSVITERLRQRDGDLVGRLQANLGVMEQVAVALFGSAAQGVGLNVPDGPVNPYAIGLDPGAWERDGLWAGRRVEPEPWIRDGLERAWLTT